MHNSPPPLSALRAFEAAARQLSLTKAAFELNVTPGALSPGLQAGFLHIRDALASLDALGDTRVLVISAPPGFTAKWLAPRLYRFSIAHPEIDVRVSSSIDNANFTSDGVDAAIRNMPIDAAADPALVVEKLIELTLLPVCSPRLIEAHGPLQRPEALGGVPLLHDVTLAGPAKVSTWAEWLTAAGVDGVDVSRGLRFNSAHPALDAAGEAAGVLLAHDVLAYDDLRTGRLVIAVEFALQSDRAYHFVCPKI